MIESIAPLLDAGRVKVYCVQSYDSWTWHDKSAPLEERAQRHGHYEDWILNRVVPWIAEDTAGGRRADRDRLQLRRLPRRQLLPQAGRPVPARDLPERRLRRLGGRLGRPRRQRLLQQPGRLRREPRRRPPRLAAQSGEPPARVRAGAVGGHDGRTGIDEPLRAAPRERRGSAASSTSGATTSRTTGRPGARSSPTTCRGSADAPSHLVGLLLGTEEDWPGAFEAIVERVGPFTYGGETHELVTERVRQRALRPALHAALLARDRPARVVVLPAARVAEEDRPDGRRLPAQQPVHLPGDGEARGLLRDDPARPEGARDLAAPAQAPAAERALRVGDGQVRGDGVALQRAVRPRRDRRARRLPAVHEAVRRRPVGRRHADRRRRGAPRRIRRARASG